MEEEIKREEHDDNSTICEDESILLDSRVREGEESDDCDKEKSTLGGINKSLESDSE